MRKFDYTPPVDNSFRGITKRSFQFLIDEFGFHLVEDPSYYVMRSVLGKYEFLRYISDRVFVRIGYSSYEYELDLGVGFLTENEQDEVDYDLNEILDLAGEKECDLIHINKSSVVNTVPRMAFSLRTYGLKAIIGDPEYYKQLAELRDVQSHQLMFQYAQEDISRDIGLPWKRKNYKQVIRIYERYERYLTDEQKTRLEFARQQVQKSSHFGIINKFLRMFNYSNHK